MPDRYRQTATAGGPAVASAEHSFRIPVMLRCTAAVHGDRADRIAMAAYGLGMGLRPDRRPT